MRKGYASAILEVLSGQQTRQTLYREARQRFMLWALGTVVGTGILASLTALVMLMHRQTGVVLHTLSTTQAPSSPLPPPRYDDTELRRQVEALTKAVAHGIDHVDRNEKRVRGIVTGAIKRFENSEHFDAAVDAELETLPAEQHDPEEAEAQPVRMTEPSSVDDDLAATGMIPGDWQ